MGQYLLEVLLPQDFNIRKLLEKAIQEQSEIPLNSNTFYSKQYKVSKEMHQMVQMHRDLKPDNIMVSFNPLKVAVIDLNIAIRKENSRLGKALGTPEYFPNREKWLDGSILWDIWVIAAIILECDLVRDEYFKTESEEKAKGFAILHLSYVNVCKHIEDVVTKIILKALNNPNFS